MLSQIAGNSVDRFNLAPSGDYKVQILRANLFFLSLAARQELEAGEWQNRISMNCPLEQRCDSHEFLSITYNQDIEFSIAAKYFPPRGNPVPRQSDRVARTAHKQVIPIRRETMQVLEIGDFLNCKHIAFHV